MDNLKIFDKNIGKEFGVDNTAFDYALQVVLGLSGVQRTGWVKRGVENPETVGQHTDALVELAKKVCAERPELDRKKLERMLQIHDWAEYKTGDIVTAHLSDEERGTAIKDKHAKELEAMEVICAKLGKEGEEIMALWHDFENGGTPEAIIGKQLDKLQAMLKAWEYEQAGETVSAQEFIDYDRKKITDPLLVGWLDQLQAEINNR